VIIAADPSRAEADLQAGTLTCPACGGRLRGWSHARARSVRQLTGPDLVLRSRRARCEDCSRTQVIVPAASVPRRADATEVIGHAWHAKASGRGHRRIAADLGRSPSAGGCGQPAARTANGYTDAPPPWSPPCSPTSSTRSIPRPTPAATACSWTP
jgi:hypothetical protein